MKRSFVNMYIKNIIYVVFLIIYFISFDFVHATNKDFIGIESPAAVVIDSETGRVLFGKNENEKRKMASLTKIMTSILLVENCDMDEMIEVPKEVAWIGGSTVGLKPGDMVSARSLLYGMLLPSGNDCAYTVGIHIGGSVENFAKMMNDKAKKIGAEDTCFSNPHGLDAENHYTTAKSMALMTRYALKNKDINEIMGTRSATVNFGSFSKLVTNTNALLKNYPPTDGGKTGFTNGANRCLVATATADSRRFIAVVLGSETTNQRFSNTKTILEESFNRYTKVDVSKYLNFHISIPVEKGDRVEYERSISDNLTIPLQEGEYDRIYVRQDIVSNLKAPVCAGEYLGKIQVFIDEEVIYEKEIYLEENINKKTVLDYMEEGFKSIFKNRSII